MSLLGFFSLLPFLAFAFLYWAFFAEKTARLPWKYGWTDPYASGSPWTRRIIADWCGRPGLGPETAAAPRPAPARHRGHPPADHGHHGRKPRRGTGQVRLGGWGDSISMGKVDSGKTDERDLIAVWRPQTWLHGNVLPADPPAHLLRACMWIWCCGLYISMPDTFLAGLHAIPLCTGN